MANIITKRSVMTCFSEEDNIYCHQVRIVLSEKGINVDIVDINPNDPPEDFVIFNPYQILPTLVDRELVIYSSPIIVEYIDERFPHPPLLPVYPVARAKSRLMMSRIEEDWHSLIKKLDNLDINSSDYDSTATQIKKELIDSIVSVNSIFKEYKYFLSDEFSLVDCFLAPILWRLPKYRIELPKQAKDVKNYAERIFARDSFQVSLTKTERSFAEQNEGIMC